jgi:co-chaperonin GroES (HSP10)
LKEKLMAIEVFDLGRPQPPFAESDVPKLKAAAGRHLIIIREALPEKSSGGLYLPGNAKITKRRGWVLFSGTGFVTKYGRKVDPPWKKGDYVVADRKFNRPDPTEDDLCRDPSIMVLDSADVLAIDEDRRPPADIARIIEKYGD